MAIDIESFTDRLITKRALQYAKDYKMSEAVAHAAATAAVEELLDQPYEVKDSFFEGLSEDRQIGIIQLLKYHAAQAPAKSRGKGSRKSKGQPNYGVAKRHWGLEDAQLKAIAKKHGFASFEEFYDSKATSNVYSDTYKLHKSKVGIK